MKNLSSRPATRLANNLVSTFRIGALLFLLGSFLSTVVWGATASFSPTDPTPGPNDIASLIGASTSGGDSDYTNNVSMGSSAYIAGNQSIVGQTFTTGSNPFGYLVNSVTLRQVVYKTYCEVYDTTYTIRITSPSGGSLSVLNSETCFVANGTPDNIPTIFPLYSYSPGSGIYITFTFESPWVLAPNTTYGFDVGNSGGYSYWETDGTNSNVYAGGTAYASGANGIGNTALNAQTGDRIFVVGLTALSAPYAPFITSQPQPRTLYAGRNAEFNVSAGGTLPLSYQWRKNGASISDTASISGTTNSTLNITAVTAGDAGSYTVVITNAGGARTSAPVALTVLSAPAVGTYAHTALSNNPTAYWRMSETGDPTTGSLTAFDNAGGHDGTYGTGSVVNVAGPRPASFPGFESTNTAVQTSTNNATRTWVRIPGLNFTGNSVTLTAWIRPNGNQGDATGLITTRAGTAAGLNFSGDNQLGYLWNGGAPGTWQFESGLRPQSNQWSFVALVIEPTKATIYLGAGGTLNAAVNPIPHTTEVWSGNGQIGGDQEAIDWRIFDGLIDEVAAFDSALSFDQINGLYGAGLGTVPSAAPIVVSAPKSAQLFEGRTAHFTASAVGSSPLSYQWKKNGVNVSGANVSGATTDSLTISSVSSADVADYALVVSNAFGVATSAPPASLTVITPVPGSYPQTVNGYNPVAYFRLNETEDPSTGQQPAYDLVGGRSGTYTVAAQNGFNSKEGPRPAAFTGFESSNAAVQTTGIGDFATPSWVWLPALPINTNTVSFTLWIKPNKEHGDYNGLIMNRQRSGAGMNFTVDNQIGYTWNDGNQNTWDYKSGLRPPVDEWSFVALVIDPAKATFYLYNSTGQATATNEILHTADSLGGRTQLGGDQEYPDWRIFDGLIDEVAIFDYALTPAQVQNLYTRATAAPVLLTIQKVGGNLQLSWPQGTLLEANSLAGPFATNNATSPYTFTPTGASKFFRVKVQ